MTVDDKENITSADHIDNKDKDGTADDNWANQSTYKEKKAEQKKEVEHTADTVHSESTTNAEVTLEYKRDMFDMVRDRRGAEFHDLGGDTFSTFVNNLIASTGLTPKTVFNVEGKRQVPVLSDDEKAFHVVTSAEVAGTKDAESVETAPPVDAADEQVDQEPEPDIVDIADDEEFDIADVVDEEEFFVDDIDVADSELPAERHSEPVTETVDDTETTEYPFGYDYEGIARYFKEQ